MRSLPALYQDDDDGNDLSDLGLSTGKKNSGGNYDEQEMLRDHATEDHHSCSADDGANNRVLHRIDNRTEDLAEEDCEEEDVFRGAEEPAALAVKVATVQTIAAVAPMATEPVVAENGYDRAIKDYVDFTESKRTSVGKCEEQPLKSCKPTVVEIRRRMSAPKIEEKVMLLKTRSQSTRDLNAVSANELPKVDIGKRREIFEKICSETKAADVQHTVAVRQPSLAKKKSVKASPTPSPPGSVAAADVDVFPQQVAEDISSLESSLPGKNYVAIHVVEFIIFIGFKFLVNCRIYIVYTV